jgi:hypothetical protein
MGGQVPLWLGSLCWMVCAAVALTMWPAGGMCSTFIQDGVSFGGVGPLNPIVRPQKNETDRVAISLLVRAYSASVPTTSRFLGAVSASRALYLVPGAAMTTLLIRVSLDSGAVESFGQPPPEYVAAGSSANVPFCGAAFDGARIWLAPYRYTAPVMVNITSGESRQITLPDSLSPMPAEAFSRVLFDGDHVWFAPYAAKELMRINAASDVVDLYDLPADVPASFGSGAMCFDGKFIWIAPSLGVHLIRVTKGTGAMATFSQWPVDMTQSQGFEGCTYDGSHLWLAPRAAGMAFVRVNVSSGEMTAVTHNLSTTAFKSVIFDGASAWFVPAQGTMLARVDVTTEYVSTYDIAARTGYACEAPAQSFGTATFDGEAIWLAPLDFPYLVRVGPVLARHQGSVATNTAADTSVVRPGSLSAAPASQVAIISDKVVWPSKFPYTAMKRGAGATFDGNRTIYLCPCDSNMVVALDTITQSTRAIPLPAVSAPLSSTRVYYGCALIGSKLYLTPSSIGFVGVLDVLTQEFRKVIFDNASFGSQYNLFMGSVLAAGRVWFPPVESRRILSIDTGTDALHYTQSSLLSAIATGQSAYCGGLYDGMGTIWLAPYEAPLTALLDVNTETLSEIPFPNAYTRVTPAFCAGRSTANGCGSRPSTRRLWRRSVCPTGPASCTACLATLLTAVAVSHPPVSTGGTCTWCRAIRLR